MIIRYETTTYFLMLMELHLQQSFPLQLVLHLLLHLSPSHMLISDKYHSLIVLNIFQHCYQLLVFPILHDIKYWTVKWKLYILLLLNVEQIYKSNRVQIHLMYKPIPVYHMYLQLKDIGNIMMD